MMNDYLLLFKLSQADDDLTITKIAEWATIHTTTATQPLWLFPTRFFLLSFFPPLSLPPSYKPPPLLPSSYHPFSQTYVRTHARTQAEQEEVPLEYLTGPPPPAQDPQPFSVPEVKGSAGAWGPAVGSFPEKFRDMPFQPFSKSDRLGKAADITGTAFQSRQNRYQSMFGAGDA